MTDKPATSDEPTRVAQLVKLFLEGQTGARTSPGSDVEVTLSLGGDRRDDCAVYDISGPVSLVVGSDYIRGSKFTLYELGLLSNFDIGYYLVAANVSDIAAMGATPIGVLTVVRYPPELDDAGFAAVMAGIHQACTDFGTLNVGGDIGNAERLVLSGTALGVSPRANVLTRGGARPGDMLCVTGPCGLLGAAVAYFPKRAVNGWALPADVEQELLNSWKRPVARVAEGLVLSSRPFATSCQDTSDGLKATIDQLAEASNVGFDIIIDHIAVNSSVAAVAQLMGVSPLALAMSASADFQLAFTLPADKVDECRKEFYTHGLGFDVIGSATASGAVRTVNADGSYGPLPGVAWKHQASDISTLVSDDTQRQP